MKQKIRKTALVGDSFMKEKIRFRYGWDEKHMGRISTLCTIRPERSETVYFGISLCSKTDMFVKEIGRKIALGRARKALEDLEGYEEAASFELMPSKNNGLRGHLSAENIINLLEYFRTIGR